VNKVKLRAQRPPGLLLARISVIAWLHRNPHARGQSSTQITNRTESVVRKLRCLDARHSSTPVSKAHDRTPRVLWAPLRNVSVAENKKATKRAKFDAPTRGTRHPAILVPLPSRPHQASASPSTLLVSGAVVKEDRSWIVSGVFEWLQDRVTGCLPGARRSPRL